MSKVTDSRDFWLPNDFLTADEDDDIRFTGSKLNRASTHPPSHFSAGFDSFRNISPVESLFSSTETESDEEESLEWLARKIASSSLQMKDDFWAFRRENNKKWDCTGFSVPPPPKSTTPFAGVANRSDAAWDILYEAAKDLARMRLIEEASGYYQNRGLRNHGQGFTPLKRQNSDFGAGFNDYKQLQLAQFMQMQQRQQMMKQQEDVVWGRNDKTGGVFPYNHQNRQVIHNRITIPDRNHLSEKAWPTLHQTMPNQPLQQSGSGMRAVFLGNNGAKRECAGTGVFLPRQAGTPADNRKKPGCSTVLLPDRVVQALNLNLEAMELKTHNQSRPVNMSVPAHYGGYRGEVLIGQKGSSSSNSITGKTTVNQEIGLPQEWIY